MKMTLAALLIGSVAFSSASAWAGDVDLGTQAWRSRLQPAVDRAIQFLEKRVQTNGGWMPLNQPAITALALNACMQEPSGRIRAQQPSFVARGYEQLLRGRREDGAFGTNYITYNTALALIALHASNKPEYAGIIRRGRVFLAAQQADFDEKGKTDHPFDGGIGYGDGSGKVNLANTHAALEALFWTGTSDGGRKVEWAALDTVKMRGFINRCQNVVSVNRGRWADEDNGNRGGFMYYPGKSFAGEITNANGKVSYTSYGSMTCVGLAGYMYLGVPRDSHEVSMAGLWLQKNFTLQENPRMGQDGLYYYYMVLAKALSLYGEPLGTSKEQPIDWRTALADRLLSLQKPDGSWVNASERWLEAEPVLATSYALTTLNTLAQPVVAVTRAN